MAAPRSLKARALQWLAQREHSRAELGAKLRRAAAAMADEHEPAAAAAQVAALLDWLEANRFLSQERFVESRVNARSVRFGNLRIQQELRQHQLALPPQAEQALRDSELQRARAVRARKFAEPPSTAAEHARQARFLGGRGFSPEVIRRVLREPDVAD